MVFFWCKTVSCREWMKPFDTIQLGCTYISVQLYRVIHFSVSFARWMNYSWSTCITIPPKLFREICRGKCCFVAFLVICLQQQVLVWRYCGISWWWKASSFGEITRKQDDLFSCVSYIVSNCFIHFLHLIRLHRKSGKRLLAKFQVILEFENK